MSKFQKFSAALLLIGTLSLSAFGGQIEIGYQPPPQPTPMPAGGEMSTPVNGDMHTTNSDEATAGEAVAADVLSLVQVVLSLL